MTQPSRYLNLPWTWDITYSADDSCFVVTVAEFPDFFAAGATAGEAAKNSREALISHISGYVTTGRALPQPKGAANRATSATQGPKPILVLC